MTKREKQFLEYLAKQRFYSDKTITSYQRDIDLLENYLTENGYNYSDLDQDKIDEFLRLQKQTGISHRTLQRRISAYRSFFSYLYKIGDIEKNCFIGIATPKAQRKIPDVLYEDSISKILEKNKLRTDDLAERDQAILELLFASGIRAAELVDLTKNQINFRTRTMTITGKGRKTRIAPFSEEAEESLRRYIDNSRNILLSKNPNSIRVLHVFLNKNGRQLTVRGLEYILKEVERKLELSYGLHPHECRHSFATMLLQNGADLRLIQEILGHSSINTTSIYTHTTVDNLIEEYQKYFPKK